MGSSSSLTVSLLTALYAFQGKSASPEKLASQACSIEIDRLKSPIGRQDQYIAAYGGLQYIRFDSDDSVHVEPVPCTSKTLAALEERLLLFYTGGTRDANEILQKQSAATAKKFETLRRMRDLAGEMREALAGEHGDLLHEGWELKRSLLSSVSTPLVDEWYAKARGAGARGGKLLGAGGGGFLLVFAEPDRHDAIRRALGRPRELPVGLDPLGSRVIFIGRRA
jgi:D-glycero-alpha-D-manno-heptose-7-phosphate kinase